MVDRKTQKSEREKERAELMVTIRELMKINNIPKIPYKELSISKKVAEGGQGKVYLCKYKETDVALKLLIDIDHKCLAHEIVILSNMKHECIPKFYGLVLEDDMIGFVNSLINGKPLDEINLADLNEELKLKIVIKLANTLKYIHENTFIHRDLKPGNMMLDSDLNFFLIDFGIAKVMTNMVDTITRAKGTIYYIAPETLEVAELTEKDEIVSKITTKVDVWAFGCIVSYLFSGKLPWTNKYNDQPSAVQKLLLKKVEFPIPEEEIKSYKYRYSDLIIEIIKASTIIDSEKRFSMKQIIEKYLSKVV